MTTEELLALNPFPGLRAFTTGESDRFFGRQQQIDELVALLGDARLVGVAGASGCGKSSLVLAGLTGELARLGAEGEDIEWRPVVMRPGNHSIANLAQALSGALGMQGDEARTDALYGRLSLGVLGLVEAIRAARLEPNVRVLVIVDQFEEIFRFRQAEPEEPSAFVKLLLTAVQDSETPIGVVLTLRSSELGKCADFPDLAEAVSRGQYLVPKLARDQRKEAIVKPIEGAGFRIAPRLVQRILNDVSDDFDDLPVMQHVLSRTWQRWALTSDGKRPIDVEDYEAVGTAARALSNHADEAYDSLPGLGPLVEQVFRALTERVDGGIENRRPLEFNRLCAVTGGDPADVARVIERFRRADTAFLMPPPSVPLATNPVIDISHESLIRQWQRLRDWAKSESDSRSALIRVLQSARRHEKDEGDLAQGRDLERMLAWRQGVALTPAWVELYAREDGATGRALVHKFLDLSAAAADRARRRRRIQVWSVRALAIALLIIGWLCAVVGLKLHDQAKASDLATRALLEMDVNPAQAAHLALAALHFDDNVPTAEQALMHSLAALELVHTVKVMSFDDALVGARLDGDGSRLTVAAESKTYIYDTATYSKPQVLEGIVRVLADGWTIRFSADAGPRVEQHSTGRAETLSCGGETGAEGLTEISRDGRRIALSCASGEVLQWDVSGREQRRPAPSPGSNQPVSALAFSADGDYLAVGYQSGAILLWKRGETAPHMQIDIGGAADPAYARQLAFDPRMPARLAAAMSNQTARVWALDLDGRKLAPGTADKPAQYSLVHNHEVSTVEFVPAGPHAGALMTQSEKRVRLWQGAKLVRTFKPHGDNLTSAQISPDGLYLATASFDGNAGLSSMITSASVALLHGHEGVVMRALFRGKRDGALDGELEMITVSDMDRSVRVWHIRPPELLAYAGDEAWKFSAAFDPSGQRIAYCGIPQPGVSACGIVERSAGPRDASRVRQLPSSDDAPARQVSWSSDGKWIVAKHDGSSVALWDAAAGTQMTPKWLAAESDPSSAAVFSAGTRLLLTAGERGVAVWDSTRIGADGLEPIRRFPATEGPPYTAAAISPDGRWIALARYSLKGPFDIEVRDLKDKTAIPLPLPKDGERHTALIMDLQFSPDSKSLISASADRTARLWRLVSPPRNRPVVRFAGHSAYVVSAAVSHNGRRVVTASADGTIGVWNAETGNRLATLRWHEDEPNQVRFDASDTRILSAADDGTVKLGRCESCKLTPPEMRARVAERAGIPDEFKKRIEAETTRFPLPAFLSR